MRQPHSHTHHDLLQQLKWRSTKLSFTFQTAHSGLKAHRKRTGMSQTFVCLWSSFHDSGPNPWSSLHHSRPNPWSSLHDSGPNPWSSLHDCGPNPWSSLHDSGLNPWSSLHDSRPFPSSKLEVRLSVMPLT